MLSTSWMYEYNPASLIDRKWIYILYTKGVILSNNFKEESDGLIVLFSLVSILLSEERERDLLFLHDKKWDVCLSFFLSLSFPHFTMTNKERTSLQISQTMEGLAKRCSDSLDDGSVCTLFFFFDNLIFYYLSSSSVVTSSRFIGKAGWRPRSISTMVYGALIMRRYEPRYHTTEGKKPKKWFSKNWKHYVV